MMYRDDVDRALVEWITEQDRSRAPYLDEVLAVTQRTAQRPPWSFPGRWLPIELTMPRVGVPRVARYVVLLALLLLALAVASVALVGSRRPVAPPFGPASNGVVAYTTSARDIAIVDPSTNAVRILVGGPERDTTPVFSRNGSRLAYVRQDGGRNVLYAVDASGGTPTPLTRTQLGAIGGLAWSPDGSRLAFTAGGRIHVVKTDGSGASMELPLGVAVSADAPVWRPPDGRELLFRGASSTGFQLYLAPSDGAGRPAALTDAQPQEYAWIHAAFTPDGRRIVTQRYAGVGFDDGHYVVTTFTLESVIREALDPTDAAPPGVTTVAPILSPDGTRVAVIGESREPGSTGISVLSLDDPASIRLLWPITEMLDYYRAWTPDGSAILVWALTGEEVWILDPSDGSREQRPWSGVTELDWQRTSP